MLPSQLLRRRPAGYGPQSSIEGHDLADAAPATAGKMAEVSGSQHRILLMELPGQRDILLLQRPHLHPGPGHQRHRRIERLHSRDRKIRMDQFLQDLRRRTQGSPIPVAHEEEFPGYPPKWMWPSYRVHEDIWCRRRSCSANTASPRFVDDLQVLLPVRFHLGTFQCVALPEESVQVLRRFEGYGTLFFPRAAGARRLSANHSTTCPLFAPGGRKRSRSSSGIRS